MSRRAAAVTTSSTGHRHSPTGTGLSTVTGFTAVNNQIHFHPDPRFGGLGVLVLFRPSALRPAGVHVLPGTLEGWYRAHEVGDLPVGRWVGPRDASGRPLAVQLRRIAPGYVRIRWLGHDGRPVAPWTWDLEGMSPAQRSAAGVEPVAAGGPPPAPGVASG